MHRLMLAVAAFLCALAAASPSPARTSRPPHYQQWMCIHRYEGAWNDYGDPYWGGLQMDRSFMWAYGSWAIRRYGGFAHRWPPLVQMWVAEAAWRTRGFHPWPNTARMCGLL